MNLCSFFGHKWIHSEKWIPSIEAEIVEEYIFTHRCVRCGKKEVTHGVWSGAEFKEEVKGQVE